MELLQPGEVSEEDENLDQNDMQQLPPNVANQLKEATGKQAACHQYMKRYWERSFKQGHKSLFLTVYFVGTDFNCCIEVAETAEWTTFQCRACETNLRISAKMKFQAVLEHCSTTKHIAAVFDFTGSEAKEWHHEHVHPFGARCHTQT